VEKIVEGFFDGSPQALAAHLSSLPAQQGVAREFLSPEPAAVDGPGTPGAELQTPNLDERLL